MCRTGWISFEKLKYGWTTWVIRLFWVSMVVRTDPLHPYWWYLLSHIIFRPTIASPTKSNSKFMRRVILVYKKKTYGYPSSYIQNDVFVWTLENWNINLQLYFIRYQPSHSEHIKSSIWWSRSLKALSSRIDCGIRTLLFKLFYTVDIFKQCKFFILIMSFFPGYETLNKSTSKLRKLNNLIRKDFQIPPTKQQTNPWRFYILSVWEHFCSLP